MLQEIKQRTDEWFEQRLGLFTASEIHKLMGVKGIGKTGETYAFEKACEIVFGREEDNFVSWDMQRGIELEPVAFDKFKELNGMFLSVDPAHFFPYGDNAGASPDGLVGSDSILEIKCPKRDKLLRLMAFGKDEIDQNYILQMQMQMLCTKSSSCYFFNYGLFDGVEMWHEIKVERDEKIIETMISRIAEATKKRDEYVELLNSNKQF